MNAAEGKIIAELRQRQWSKGKRDFVLREDGTVEARYRQGFRSTSFALNARLLEPAPVRQRHRAVSMMIGAAVFALLDSVFIIGGLAGSTEDGKVIAVSAGGLFLIPVVLCLWEYYRQSFDAVIFFSNQLGNRLVLIDAVPTREAMERFTKELSETIFRLRQRWDTTSPNAVVDRIKELAHMKEQRLISEEEYQKLKTELIATEKSDKTVGFK